MRRHPSLPLLACLLVAGAAGWLAPRPAPGAEPPVVACSAETPTVALGDTVGLGAWASTPSGQLQYAWEAPVGRLESRGRQSRWDLAGLPAGGYAAAVRVSDPAGGSTECVVRVVVRRDAGSRGAPPPPGRETGSALLAAGGREAEGYGLYSYLLLGAPPGAAERDRYLKAIEAFWAVVPDIAALEQYVPRAELNIAYVPVRSPAAGTVSAAWVLENYDYARARSLLRLVPGSYRDGPYLLSVLKPPGGAGTAASGPYLFQDLSRVPPHLAASWVKEFLNQAAQERFWDGRAGARLALKLRVTVGILGEGLPEVRKALDDWIAWAR